MILDILFLFICYIIGSTPSGLIIGKTFKNIDIREHGSGNLGGTNAIRVLGKKLGVVVAIMDVLKGGVCVLLANLVFNSDIPSVFFGLMAVIGHVFPIFAGFRGGKAVATSGGVLLFSSWPIFLIGIITFIITLKITKYVSLSSTIVTLVIFTSSIIAYFNRDIAFFTMFNVDKYFVITIFILMMFIVIRHIPNYKRLLKGTERKIGQKK